MKVIESFVEGKDRDPSLCEDLIFIGENFAAVFDGATDKVDARYEEIPGGRFAVEVLAKAMERLHPEASPPEGVRHLSAELSAAISANGSARDPRDDPSASAVIFSIARSEIWRVGDCSWSLDGEADLGEKLIDRITAETRAALLEAMLIGGASMDDLRASDPGRAMVLQLLEEQYRFRNIADPSCRLGFGAIDGTPVPARFIEAVPVGPSRDIVLATDGYPRLLPTLKEAEAALLDDIAIDPLRIGDYKSTKAVGLGQSSFDDRAYLRFRT
jgi:hypothetical protein